LANERVERRLTAIMAADVVAYSRLMGADEEGTLAQLKTCRRELVDPKIAEHRGRIVKTTGDGMLVEFASVVDAVRCAVEVQRGMGERNADVSPDSRIEFRVGINLGDIILDDEDIYGDGVNIAARLEAMADPGTVCVSAGAWEQARGKMAFGADDLGEHQLKNIERPVRVFRIARSPSETSGIKGKPWPLPDKPSLAVLPFQNMSGDPDQEYFTDGIVEDIITALSGVRSFSVIARNSSFTYKGKTVNVKQVGRELGVRYVLEGSVRKAGNRVRINGQLVETESGAHVWAHRYDGDLDDVFALQDEITAQVVTAVEPRVQAAEIERLSRKKSEDLTAYDLYLRALWGLRTRTKESFTRSRDLLQTALRHDPDYAAAWALLGDCIGRSVLFGWLEDTERGIQDACDAAQRAIASDPNDGTILALAAWAFAILAGKVDRACELAIRAVELHPNSAVVLTQCGWAFLYVGDLERAIEFFRIAQRLDPLYTSRLYLPGMAAAHFFAKRFEDCERLSRQTVEETPSLTSAWRFLATSLVHLGRIEEARRAIARLLEVQPNSSVSRTAKTSKFRHEWMIKLYLDALRAAGLPE
jgi:adenylate cyclase